MNTKIATLLTLALSIGGMASANTTLLVNTNFDGFEKWIAGSNKFAPQWIEFVSAPTAYTFESRVSASGSGFVYSSWDDGTSDRLENYLFQEFGAGPTSISTPSIFETGDVIVFKGSASATRVGANTSDMIVRAFIKVLGYNELGWAFQTKPEYSAFHTIGSALEDFELTVTFPDLAVDDSLQVLQLGFEISNSYDASTQSMDSGTIYFENLEGYIVGEEAPTPTWAGFAVDANGAADTGDWMGVVFTTHAPWIYVYDIAKYVYLPEAGIAASGGWTFVPGN